jgi:glucose/arabinose dehydrogenase
MRAVRVVAVTAAATLAAVGCGGGSNTSTSNDRLVSIGAGLSGPSGLVATAYARGIAHASALGFDANGQVWVATADSSDTGQDSVYYIANAGATPTQVIASLHMPLGLLWFNGALYVTSTSGVEVYRNFNGATFASHQAVVSFATNVGLVGGIVAGPDGRMRVGISSPCDHCDPPNDYSAAVVSFMPDGTGLTVEASGIRAPVGLAYYPNTNDLFVTMNQRDDLEAATPGDWLAVVRAGQDWKFPDCYGQGGSVCSGVPAPIAVLDKHAAASGVAIITGQLGAAGGASSAIVAEWTTGKVLRVALTKNGGSYTGTVSTFISGITNPVPVALGADGALFIGDWSSGTIYRVVAKAG